MPSDLEGRLVPEVRGKSWSVCPVCMNLRHSSMDMIASVCVLKYYLVLLIPV